MTKPSRLSVSPKCFFLCLLVVSAIIRVLLSLYPKSAVTYNDELFYLELSQNIWLRGTLNVYASPIRFSKLLYPLVLSPFYAISDGLLRIRIIAVFNALLLSSSLIPGYLIAKKILKNNVHLYIALIILALSPNLLFSYTFMAENLYYPLLLWCMYFSYNLFSLIVIKIGTSRRGLRGRSESPLESQVQSDQKALVASASAKSPILLGLLIFFLYFCKETGAALFAAILIILMATKSWKSLAYVLAGFGAPWLLAKLTILRNIGYSYAGQVSFANLQTASQLMYMLFATALMLFFFLLSTLWFPVVLPLVKRKLLSGENSLLLCLSGIYTLFIAIGIAFGVLLIDEFASVTPHIHLRYFLGAAFPFLLLFFSLQEQESASPVPDKPKPLKEFLRTPLALFTAAFALFALLFFFIPSRGSLVDYPLLHFADYLNPASLKQLWLLRLAILTFLALGLWLYKARKPKLLSALIVIPLLLMELAGSFAFTRSARLEGELRDPAPAQEVAVLDQALDSLEGNLLVIAPSPHDPSLKLLNTLLNEDYALAVTTDLRDDLAAHAVSGVTALPLDSLHVKVPFERFSPSEYYALSSVDYLLTVGDWSLLDSSRNREITPPGVSSFHLYQAEDPNHLAFLDPLHYSPGDTLLFHGESPNFLDHAPAGFSFPEPGFTWSTDHEVTLSLRPDEIKPLTASWQVAMTIGDQPFEVFANDTLVASGTLSAPDTIVTFEIPTESWQEKGLLTLRFSFPEAKQPGNGDPRILAVAFDSLTLR